MLLELVRELSPRIQSKRVQTSSFVFKLITKYTVTLFFLFCLLLGTRNIFGSPIECFASDNQYLKAMELKCWIDGVFLDNELMQKELGTEVVRYGVGGIARDHKEPQYITFKFYQWLLPLMVFQTFCLFLPRLVWRYQEKGTMMKLLDGIYSPVMTDDWEKRRKYLISYIKDVRKKYHRQYAIKYLLCELLTIVVIIFNMFVVDCVITDFWIDYKPAVASFFRGDFTKFNRDAARIFPIQAKCNFDVYGPSGGIQKRDSLCILPQNVLYEKIFVLLYIWYFVILVCAILNFFYLVAMYTFKLLRIFNIGHMLERTVTIKECKELSGNGDLGLWFTLSIYRKNMVSTSFQDVCQELFTQLKHDQTLEYEDEMDY